jgi:hypothetical protein
MATKKKLTKTQEDFLKSGDTLDIAPVVEQARAQEVTNLAEARRIVSEISEVQNYEEKVERWGDRGPLTIASPGSIVEDPFYIPEVVHTYDGIARRVANHRVISGSMHTLTADSQRKYRWCRPDKINLHKRRGFGFSKYKELFQDTGLFEEGSGSTVRNGDNILMEISLDGWERMCEERDRLQAQLSGSEGNELFQEGNARGVPTFREDFKRGVREYYT